MAAKTPIPIDSNPIQALSVNMDEELGISIGWEGRVLAVVMNRSRKKQGRRIGSSSMSTIMRILVT